MSVVFLLHIFRPSSSIDAVIMLVYGYLTTAAGLKCVILDWFGRFYATHLLFICCRFILSMNNGWFHVLFQIKVVCATWNVLTQPLWFANIACLRMEVLFITGSHIHSACIPAFTAFTFFCCVLLLSFCLWILSCWTISWLDSYSAWIKVDSMCYFRSK